MPPLPPKYTSGSCISLCIRDTAISAGQLSFGDLAPRVVPLLMANTRMQTHRASFRDDESREKQTLGGPWPGTLIG